MSAKIHWKYKTDSLNERTQKCAKLVIFKNQKTIINGVSWPLKVRVKKKKVF